MMDVTTKEDYAAYQVSRYMFLVLSPTLMILGVAGNTVAFLVYYPKARAHPDKSSHFYLALLGIADSVSLLASALPGFVNQATGTDLIYLSGCGWYLFMLYTVTDISIYTIVCLTMDRAISVFAPYKVKSLCSRRRAIGTVILMTLVLITVNVHFVFTTESTNTSIVVDNVTESQRECSDVVGYLTWKMYIWPWVDIAVLSVIPFISLLLLNGGILVQMRHYRIKIHAEGNVSQQRVARQKRLNRLVASICVVFFLTTAPITALHIAEPYWSRDDPYQQAVHALVTACLGHLGYLTNCVNFLLYYRGGGTFHEDIKRLFKNRTVFVTQSIVNN